jgi:type II secretory pathway pseudopilin PulG
MAERPGRAARSALAHEDGFTIFELLMAVTILAIGLIALVSSFDHSRNLVSVAEKTEVASHRAERELERILAMSYPSVAHPSTPASAPDQASPAFYVNNDGTYQYDQDSTPFDPETITVDGGGSIGASPSTWNDSESRLTGQIQSFVTWTGDYCTPTDRALCAKRVTVAVTVGGNDPLPRPVLISSIMTNPAGTGS